ncbi:MAG: helix-turn-helix transcriptional regulator, partial [Patulibacter sp.]
GLTQEALGFKIDLHRTEVSLLERAGRDPRLETIAKLARGLGIPASELLRGIGGPGPSGAPVPDRSAPKKPVADPPAGDPPATETP